jgi:signal transduction histidine kinase/nitrogen-specific signal transduction histidine kinase
MKNLSIQLKIMAISIFIIILYTFFMALDSINTIKTISNNNIKKYEQEAYQNKENDLKSYISIAITTVDSIQRRGSKEQIKKNLKLQTNQLFSIINTFYDKYKDTMTKEELKNNLKFLIINARYANNGYYWINENEYKILEHPIYPQLNGIEVSKMYKGKAFKQVEASLKNAKLNGSGFMEYKWLRKNSKIKEDKISYLRVFKPYGWIIGTGVYLEDVKKSLQKEALETLSKMKYGKNGYFWVNDFTPTMLMHPILPELNGENLSKYTDPNGIYVFNKIVQICKSKQKGGFVRYSWIKPYINKTFQKISYVQAYEKWNWIIGTGEYVTDIQKQIEFMKNQTDEEISNIIQSFFIKIIFAISFIIILIHFLVKYNIIIPIQNFQKNFMIFIDYINSRRKDISLIKNYSNDEIGQMSNILNTNILIAKEKFDKEIELKKELKDLNDKLEVKIQEEVLKSKTIEEKLFESERLASMGEMIGNIAHQWRQPLSVISTGSTGLLVQSELGVLDNDKLIKTCTSINNNAQYLSKTIDDFRNFIKGDRIKNSFRLSSQIDSFLKLVEGSIKSNNIKIILSLDKSINIDGYENELTQCMMNIYNNAKDALVENIKEERYIFISTTQEENNIVIKIKDNANGIPTKVLPKIFDPYFTTKHQSKGTGLGLHMTYNLIVNGMNGKIEAKNVEYEYENKKYKGAMFTITLPIN